MTDLLRGGFAGMRIAPDGHAGYRIVGALTDGRPCQAAVFLDGLPLDADERIDQYVRPQHVVGVEVYRNGTFAPPKYVGAQAAFCSVVMFWTR